MLNLKTFALAAALTISAGAGSAVAAGSSLDALGSATTISFITVSGVEAANVMPGGINGNLVDIGSLKARIEGNWRLLTQLESYGATIDDVVGITGTDPANVTVFIQG